MIKIMLLKPLALCISLIIVICAIVQVNTFFGAEGDFNGMVGDVDSDGCVSISDATEIQRYLADKKWLSPTAQTAADVNKDKIVSVDDASIIQKYLCFYRTGAYIDRLRTEKVYGVEFGGTTREPVCKRTDDARGLQCDYSVDGKMQNGGKNDFDFCYPWCFMRRCCVKVSDDGTRTVIYEGENGFATDGSSGSVYVEIPKFYSRRQKTDDGEKWEISGVAHNGFGLEPAFKSGEKELESIYISAYEFTSGGPCAGVSGKDVATVRTLADFRKAARSEGASCFDYASLHAVQLLFAVEFADANTSKYMQGVSCLPYLNYANGKIVGQYGNVLKIDRCVDKDETRFDNLRVGQRVRIYRKSEIGKSSGFTGEKATVTQIAPLRNDKNIVKIKLSEVPDDSVVSTESDSYYISGIPQPSGGADSLSYHTGRASSENALSVFKYRNMENLWGNAWTLIDGLRVKELNYYYTFDPGRYGDKTVDLWKKCAYAAPNQPELGDNWKNSAWVKDLGFDSSDPMVMLPESVDKGNKQGADSRWSSALYTLYDEKRTGEKIDDLKKEYLCLFGGGWDHGSLCGLFTMRFWFADGTEVSSLHSARTVLR